MQERVIQEALPQGSNPYPLTLGRTSSHTPTVVQGGGGGVGTPPLGFCCVSIFRRDFGFG